MLTRVVDGDDEEEASSGEPTSLVDEECDRPRFTEWILPGRLIWKAEAVPPQ